MSNIYEKLQVLQRDFKAPKSEYNSHGGFKYRTLEKMLEALKPLLLANRVSLRFSDSVVESGGRPHVVATAYLTNLEEITEVIENTSLAQEADVQKGMQAAQISGSTSSYARKYALAGLLLVDDTDELDKKDGDQIDWDTEINKSTSTAALIKIFGRMDAKTQKAFTPRMGERRKELENAAANK